MRIDTGFVDNVQSGMFALYEPLDYKPIFSVIAPQFAGGQASQHSVVVTHEPFNAANTFLETSYQGYQQKLENAGVTPDTPISTPCTDLACVAGLHKQPEYFSFNSNLTIKNQVTFSGGNYIVLVNGNIDITDSGAGPPTKILVDPGATLTLVANGNITVDSNVGESAPISQGSATPVCDSAHSRCTLEGIYIADKSFIVKGSQPANAPCSGSGDKQLNIGGEVIANAALANKTTNTFDFYKTNGATDQRDLCSSDSTAAAVTITLRPDFLLSLPIVLMRHSLVWKELMP